MRAIISTTEQLKETAKINAKLPFEVVQPFIQEARDVYLVRYLGDELLEVLESEVVPERAEKLLAKTRRCLGPLALWLGNAEMSVRIGDSGFTVAKSDGGQGGAGYVPASDTKIAKVEETLERRAFNYLDLILEYLEKNADLFPEWKESRYYTLRTGNYIQSAIQFQEQGLVDIGYSRLTFEHFRSAMSMIEVRFIEKIISVPLDKTLRKKISSAEGFSPAEETLILNIRRFIACKTAEIHTSEQSKINRETTGKKEFRPVIRPIYADVNYTGNWFADQAEFYLAEIQQTLNDNATEFGIEPFNPALDWNSREKKIIIAF